MSFEFIISDESIAWRRRHGGETRLLPVLLEGFQVFFGKQILLSRNLLVYLFELFLLVGGWQLQEGRGITCDSIESFFRNRVEEGKELVEIFLFDRVVLVVMTSGTAHGEP